MITYFLLHAGRSLTKVGAPVFSSISNSSVKDLSLSRFLFLNVHFAIQIAMPQTLLYNESCCEMYCI